MLSGVASGKQALARIGGGEGEEARSVGEKANRAGRLREGGGKSRSTNRRREVWF